MSQSGSQAAAFFREIARHRIVWCVRDDLGSPAPITSSGKRAVPYWSTLARARRAAETWGQGLRAESLSLHTWRERELPRVARDGLLVGINWTGRRLVGWDLTVEEALNRLAVAESEALGGGDRSSGAAINKIEGAEPVSNQVNNDDRQQRRTAVDDAGH